MKPDGRILVMGAGVNGSVCAAALHRAGSDVTVLARGKRLEELQGGIEIEDPLKGTRTVTHVPVVDRLASEDIYEYVLVVVRKNQVRDLLPVLAQNQSQSVVFMVNTASGPDEWIAALGAKRVMLGFAVAGGQARGQLNPGDASQGATHPIWRSKGCDHRKADQAGQHPQPRRPQGQGDCGHARLACHTRCHGRPCGDVRSQAGLRYLRPGSFPEGYGNAHGCTARDARRASRKRPPHRSPQYSSPRCTSKIRRDELLSRAPVLQIWRNWCWLALLASTG